MPDITITELKTRWSRLRTLLKQHTPEAGGIIVFSRLNIYYLSGTFGNGIFWLPLEGDPVLVCRRGIERARIESPIKCIHTFKSYRDLPDVLGSAGSPLTDCFGVEMNGLSWALANSFTKYMGVRRMLPADNALSMARAIKTPFEQAIMKEAGLRHSQCFTGILPARMGAGMTEMDIVRTLSDILLEQGHHGIIRMEKYGEEAFMGHISSGDSGNHPSVFNGALGLRGLHPAVPHMGSAQKIWHPNEILMIDTGFTLEGYHTDKSHVYWSGRRDKIPARAMRAHELCLEMQGWISARLRPGAIPSEIWEHCSGWARSKGFGEGFMGLGLNKVEFAGHGIGLAVDEYPVLAKGFDLPLEAGMTLAVEPKIGLENIGMVGIENTFLVTPEGGRSLTGEDFEIVCI